MILKLKRIRSSCKYICVHCGLSSSIACIASVCEQFRSEEWGTRVKDCTKSGILFHFLALVSFPARPKPKIPFLGLSLLRNQMEALATQVSSSVVHCCDRKTSLHNRCYFFAFLSEQRSIAWSEQGVPDTRNGGRQQWCVDSVPHAPSLPRACFCSPEKRKKITPVMQAVGKQDSSSGYPVTLDCLLYLPSAIFIPTFQPK